MPIVKIIGRHDSDYSGLMKYLLQHEDETPESMFFQFRHNLRGESMSQMVAEFRAFEDRRLHKSVDNIKMQHTIISFHEGDSQHLNKSVLIELTDKFINLRAPNALHFATAHLDKAHYHIHIMSSPISEDGLSIRMSKAELKTLQKDYQLFQKQRFPQLTKSIVDFDQSWDYSRKSQNDQGTLKERSSTKRELKNKLNEIAFSSRSQEEFLAKITEANLEVYHRSGRAMGIVSNRKYRFSTLGINLEEVGDTPVRNQNIQDLSTPHQIKLNSTLNPNLDETQSHEEIADANQHISTVPEEKYHDRMNHLNGLKSDEQRNQDPKIEPKDSEPK